MSTATISTDLNRPAKISTKIWITVAEYALLMQRKRITIYDWIRNGTLKEFRIPYFQDEKGRWWIQVDAAEAAQSVSAAD